MNSLYLKYNNYLSVDQNKIDQLLILGKDIEEDVLSQLIQVHNETTKQIILDMQAHYLAKNSSELMRCAHKFKSSSANLGFMRLHHMCTDFENKLGQGLLTDQFDSVSAADFIECIQYEVQQTHLKMNSYQRVA
jgi:chemotaxis protein histidine kinase CheA